MRTLFFILFYVLISDVSLAQTPLTFTGEEKALYLQHNPLIVEVATQCLNTTWNTHVDFYNKYKISKYFGDRNPELDTVAKRLQYIRKVGAPDSIANEQEGISCIGLTRKCLQEGFRATNNVSIINIWSRINTQLLANGQSGMLLIQNLQQLGWSVLYWNPDSKNNKKWDAEEPLLVAGKPVTWNSGVKSIAGEYLYHPSWGMHEARYQTVMRTNNYYNIRIDDKTTLVDFGQIVPDSFKAQPFFVATAHAGYHVFPGFNGQVIEAHSMRRLDAFDNLEIGPFNPLAMGGAPKWTRIEKYRSGIVAVPPTR